MFKKYMHVERLDGDEVEGLLDGDVVVQPKIDGANGSIWLEAGELHCATRNMEITKDEGHGLTQWMKANHDALYRLLVWHPFWRLYGEWLIPHSLKTYRVDCWRKFYIFDVLDELGLEPEIGERERFVPHNIYQPELDKYGLNYIPILAVVSQPSIEAIQGLLERNTYLIEDGKGVGEGLVIKRYDFVNRYGRTVWGKMVRNEFKEKHLTAMGPTQISGGLTAEIIFAQEYVTRMRVEKAKAELEPWSSKKIPGVFGIVFHDLIQEELWDFLKEKKNKVSLDFNDLYSKVVQQIEAVYPELF